MKRHSFYFLVPWVGLSIIGIAGVGWLVSVLASGAITLWFLGGLKYGEYRWGWNRSNEPFITQIDP